MDDKKNEEKVPVYEAWVIAFLILLSMIFIIVTVKTLPPPEFSGGQIKTSTLPIVVFSLIIGCSLILVVSKKFKLKKDNSTDTNIPHVEGKKKFTDYFPTLGKKATLIIVALFIYVFIMNVFHFFISTVLFTFFTVRVLSEKNKNIKIGIFSILFSAAIFLIFDLLFGVPLP